jgi:hypothetical protein
VWTGDCAALRAGARSRLLATDPVAALPSHLDAVAEHPRSGQQRAGTRCSSCCGAGASAACGPALWQPQRRCMESVGRSTDEAARLTPSPAARMLLQRPSSSPCSRGSCSYAGSRSLQGRLCQSSIAGHGSLQLVLWKRHTPSHSTTDCIDGTGINRSCSERGLMRQVGCPGARRSP